MSEPTAAAAWSTCSVSRGMRAATSASCAWVRPSCTLTVLYCSTTTPSARPCSSTCWARLPVEGSAWAGAGASIAETAIATAVDATATLARRSPRRVRGAKKQLLLPFASPGTPGWPPPTGLADGFGQEEVALPRCQLRGFTPAVRHLRDVPRWFPGSLCGDSAVGLALSGDS